MSKCTASDVTGLVERLESFEDRAGVTLGALYARLETRFGPIRLNVTGEIRGSTINRLEHDLALQVAAYDEVGRVVAAKSQYLAKESFFEFEIFEISLFDLPTNKISKIKIFPRYL